MEFFAKAAAIVLSVLASVFTSVEPPKAEAVARPVVSQAQPPQAQLAPGHSFASATHPVRIVVVHSPKVGLSPDPESDWLLALITQSRKGSKPVAARPWYAQGGLFDAPMFGDTTDLLRALISGDSDL